MSRLAALQNLNESAAFVRRKIAQHFGARAAGSAPAPGGAAMPRRAS